MLMPCCCWSPAREPRSPVALMELVGPLPWWAGLRLRLLWNDSLDSSGSTSSLLLLLPIIKTTRSSVSEWALIHVYIKPNTERDTWNKTKRKKYIIYMIALCSKNKTYKATKTQIILFVSLILFSFYKYVRFVKSKIDLKTLIRGRGKNTRSGDKILQIRKFLTKRFQF